jgi:glyoxylase-like metal-dependent hydrolase (beta-lactamase superfamily II)
MRRSLSEIVLAVASYGHPDHMGGNAALREAGVTQFAGPVGDVVWLEDNDALLRELWGANPDAWRLSTREVATLREQLGRRVRMTRLLRDGDVLQVGDHKVETIITGAHSPGHLTLHDQTTRVLFSFDVAAGRGVPYAVGPGAVAPGRVPALLEKR